VKEELQVAKQEAEEARRAALDAQLSAALKGRPSTEGIDLPYS
jgi:hypothetical protein